MMEDVDIDNKPQYTVLTLPPGELRMVIAADLRQTILDVLASRPPNIVLDMEHVMLADSSIISVIIFAGTSCRKKGGQLVVARANASVRKVLSLGGVQSVILAEDLDMAASILVP